METTDGWDRVLAFHKSRIGLGLFFALAAFVVFSNNVEWTVALKVALLALGTSYWVAVGVKSIHGFKAGYRPSNPNRSLTCTDAPDQ